jgi:phosphoribosylaminoimidazolecarboxamide formyltransferase/IMP cyclohydrolase
MIEFNIPQIDLVIVDLYPLKKRLLQEQEADIIRYWWYFLIRAAAKNFKDTVIVASVDQYSLLF